MTTTMRRLTIDDWADIEAVIDSRKSFQNLPVDDAYHSDLKELYVKKRIEKPFVFFFGYFIDSKLVAISSYHTSSIQGNVCEGASWTMAGVTLPKWANSRWPSALIELRHAALDFFRQNLAMTKLWVVGPNPPPGKTWERIIDVYGLILGDPAVFKKEVWGVIPAGKMTGDPFIDSFILVGRALPQDQTVFTFTDLRPPYVRPLPPGAPEPLPYVDHEPPPRGVLNPDLETPPVPQK